MSNWQGGRRAKIAIWGLKDCESLQGCSVFRRELQQQVGVAWKEAAER